MREEDKKRPSRKWNFKRYFKKRWVLPAVYITSGAILLTAVIMFQMGNNDTANPPNAGNEATDVSSKKKNDELAVEVNQQMENFVMPVMDPESAVIKQQFYEGSASVEEQEAALVFYNNQYQPNTGINIGMEDGKTFDVVASLTGNVTKVEEDQLLGNVIEITHEKGIVTQYQAVKDIQVSVGDFVEQGEVLATAGQSQFNPEAGVHVHFEIRKDDVPLNPLTVFNKPLSSLLDDTAAEEKQDGAEDKGASEDEEETDEQRKPNEEKINEEPKGNSKDESRAS